MIATELMIGDWVSSRGKTEQVRGLYDGFICTDSFEDSHDYHFEPVLITAEILEKNGFEKQGFDGWLLVKRMGDGLAWSILWRTDCPSPHLRIDSYSYQTGSFSSFAVIYVHQLQQAQRLCKIEKEIIL